MTGLERRDPSPADAVQRNDSSSQEDEPWDQRNKGTTMRYHGDEQLDDGELPSLTRKKAQHSAVSGHVRTTTKPLKKASRNGLAAPAAADKRRFWGQLEPTTEEERERPAARRRGGVLPEEDGPDDEMAARRATHSRSPDMYEEDVDTDYSSSYGPPTRSLYSADGTVEDEEDYGQTFCGQTLTALGDICGGDLNTTAATTESQAGGARTGVKHTDSSRASTPADVQQEHTAIEVEFVEPTKRDMPPERKNAFLSAMARKAKRDFDDKKTTKNNKKEEENEATAAPEPDDDVYSSFNAAEKRKFLKLINSGVTPAEATAQVLEEQKAAEEEAAKKAKEDKARKRAARLAFWKRSGEPKSPRSPTSPASADEDEELQRVADAGVALASTEKAARNTSSPKPSVCEEKTRSVTKASLEEEARDVTEKIPTYNLTRSGSEEDSIPFKKSGINYYDAVRRLQEEDAESPLRLSSSMVSQKRDVPPSRQRGFEALDDASESSGPVKNRAASAPRLRFDGYTAAKDPTSPRTSRRSMVEFLDLRRARKSKEVESAVAGTLAAADSGILQQRTRSFDEEYAAFQTAASSGRTVENLLRDAKSRRPRKEEEAMKRIEEDLLRPASVSASEEANSSRKRPGPMPISPSQRASEKEMDRHLSPLTLSPGARSVEHEDPSSEQRANEALTLPNFPSSNTAHSHANGDKALDVSMDTYLKSTSEPYSAAGARGAAAPVPVSDAVSVYTTGTNVTGASSYTQSSRVRRPGAAKSRLAKQKELEKAVSAKGWQESIRAVAQSQNRVWDPKKGWVDYEEPESEMIEAGSKEKIHLNLDKSVLSHKSDENGELSSKDGPAIPVPFPSQWEKDRSSMIENPVNSSSEQKMEEQHISLYSTGEDVADKPEEKKIDMSMAGESRSMVASRNKDSPSQRGWVESMRAASAALAEQGRIWDPEYGWRSANENGGKPISDVVDFGVETSQDDRVNSSGAVDIGVQVSSPGKDDDLFGDRDQPTEIVEDNTDREPQLLVSLSSRNSDKKLNQWMAKAEKALKPRSELSTEASSDKAVASASAATELYLRTGNSGSDQQQETQQNETRRATNSTSTPPSTGGQTDDAREDESAPLIGSVGGFSDDKPLSSPIVDVVKEKVGAEDMNLFPDSNSRSASAKEAIAETPRTIHSSQASRASVDSSRRGAGPVDVDEVDETWDSDDEEHHSKGWISHAMSGSHDSNESEEIVVKGWNTPGHHRVVRVETSRESRSSRSSAGGSTGSLPKKKVPKLQRSKRDTSPLIGRKTPITEPVEQTDLSHASRPETPTARSTHSREASRGEFKPDDLVRADRDEYQLVGERNYRKPPTQRNDLDTPDSPSVKARRQQWENRIEMTHSGDADEVSGQHVSKQPNHMGAAGWKSFLGKKVRAESAAAAGQSELSEKFRTRIEPEGEKSEYKKAVASGHLGDQRVFEKTLDTATTSALDLSDVSPIHVKDEISGSDLESSVAYGPTEQERKSFFQRLTECTAPVMPSKKDNGVGLSTPQPSGSSRFVPTSLCGRPDVVAEQDGESYQSRTSASQDEKSGEAARERRPAPRDSSASNARVSTGSEVSTDFGAKSAYLDAIAMKAAVSKPRRSSSRRKERGSGSSVTSASTDHSEKWKAFLERKRSSGASPGEGRVHSTSDVSKAAEKYAAEKVEEMMSRMSARSQSAPKNRETRRDIDDMIDTSGEMYEVGPPKSRKKADSVRAAEDLAAARVEAMMAALSSTHLDEGEI